MDKVQKIEEKNWIMKIDLTQDSTTLDLSPRNQT